MNTRRFLGPVNLDELMELYNFLVNHVEYNMDEIKEFDEMNKG